jgi:tetratricopeptide (TPR) repeat protein
MAYVRTKGNQVLVVHGVRTDGGVEQQTLFTFYTKAEIEAAIGEHHQLFRHMLESGHPTIRIDWEGLVEGLRAHLEHVPDAAPSHENAAAAELRSALVELTRVIWELDPQELGSAMQLVDDNRTEIRLLTDKLQSLLKATPPPDSKFTRDTPSLWRQAAKSRNVPLRGWEDLDNLWDGTKYAEVKALGGLLSGAFPMFADARNYLGLAAMERGEFAAALAHFRDAEDVGRKQFPRRIAKSRYWSDHATRPFLRAIMHQVSAHNRLGEYDTALALCDRLTRDYGQDISADDLRVPVLLNAGSWAEAARVADSLVGLYPVNHFPLALAYWELGERTKAHEHFVCGAVQLPATGALLVGGSVPKGIANDPRDYNTGVSLLRHMWAYRQRHKKSLQAFRPLWLHPAVKAAIHEADEAEQKRCAERGADRTWYAERMRLRTIENARDVVGRVGAGEAVV